MFLDALNIFVGILSEPRLEWFLYIRGLFLFSIPLQLHLFVLENF